MSEQQIKSIQGYNKAAENLKKELKDFFIVENNSGVHFNVSQQMTKQFIIPSIKFHHSTQKEKFLERLELFGFPVPTISGTQALFNHADTPREVVTTNVVESALNNGLLEGIYKQLVEWANEKNYKNRICKGSHFIRAQGGAFARSAVNFLKIRFAGEYKFQLLKEDIFVLPLTAQVQTEVQTPQTRETKIDFLSRVIFEIFEIEIFDSTETEGKIIIGFSSEELVQKARRFCTFYELPSEINGTTLIFELPETHLSFDDIKELHASYIEPEDLNHQALVVVQQIGPQSTTEKAFFAEVRQYVKEKGYTLMSRTSLTKVGSFQYAVGFLQDCELIIATTRVEKPEWKIDRKTPTSNYIIFSLKGSTSEQSGEPETQDKHKNEVVSDYGIPKRIRTQIDSLRCEVDHSVMDKKNHLKAIDLIKEIGKRFGLKYKKVMSNAKLNQNSRYFVWDNKKRDIEKIETLFTQLGYSIQKTKSIDSVCFVSIFPIKECTTGITQKSEMLNEPVIVPAVNNDLVAGGVVLALSKEQIASVLVGASEHDLAKEIIRRHSKFATIFMEEKISNKELLEEIKRRGPEFAKLLFESFWKK